MLLIPCPHCGFRDESEFVYGGSAIKFPSMDGDSGEKEWNELVHLRKNPRGVHPEFWYHDAGCECWIEVKRDTSTHTIIESRPAPGAQSPAAG